MKETRPGGATQKLAMLRETDLSRFLDHLAARYQVYVPVLRKGHRHFERYPLSAAEPVIGEVRTAEPLKSFFLQARERVAVNFESDCPSSRKKPIAIIGAKACDLKGFLVQDFVFYNPDSPDPFYSRNREETLLISADCTTAIDTCFCLAVGVEPHPVGHFDLNLSSVPKGFVVEAGSAKGENLLKEDPALFGTVDPEDLRARDEQRAHVAGQVKKNLKQHEVPDEQKVRGAVGRAYTAPLWEEEAKTCVECGACTQICPTCHCFLLYDQKKKEGELNRFRTWDSCLLKDYARVAGGANPRKRLWTRLRNRFEKKFDYFPKVSGTLACTGCGRCISACPARIDIRRVMKNLAHV